MISVSCPHCQDASGVVRFGFNRSGTARCRCSHCKKTFTLDPRPTKLTEAKRAAIERALTERISQRGIARTLGVSRDTIRAVRKKRQNIKTEYLVENGFSVPAEPPKGDTVEMDEICLCFSPGLWLWLSVPRTLGVVLGFVLGDRSDATLLRLWEEEMPYAWKELPVCTDAWGAYGRILPPELHEVCDKGSGKTSKVEALKYEMASAAIRLGTKIVWSGPSHTCDVGRYLRRH